MGTVHEMILIMSKITEKMSLDNTVNLLLAKLKIVTIWDFQCESISDLMVDL